MADLLTADEVATALGALPGWTGDTSRLVRSTDVPEPDQDKLIGTIMTVADEMNHHPKVEREGNRVTFLVWTHSAGGVTARDVDLAARIDEVLSGPASSAG